MNQELTRAFSIKQAAKELGVSAGTIKNRIGDGTLASVRLGRRVLIPARVIARLLGDEG